MGGHVRPGQPCFERPARTQSVYSRLTAAGLLSKLRVVVPAAISRDDLLAVHEAAYVQRVFDTSEAGDVGAAARKGFNDAPDMFATGETLR